MLPNVTEGRVEDGQPQPIEIFSFNQTNLDVEELERRLELASTLPGADASCWNLCGSLCVLCSQNTPFYS